MESKVAVWPGRGSRETSLGGCSIIEANSELSQLAFVSCSENCKREEWSFPREGLRLASWAGQPPRPSFCVFPLSSASLPLSSLLGRAGAGLQGRMVLRTRSRNYGRGVLFLGHFRSLEQLGSVRGEPASERAALPARLSCLAGREGAAGRPAATPGPRPPWSLTGPLRQRGPGPEVRSVPQGPGGPADHAVRPRLLRRLCAALGGAGGQLPGALPRSPLGQGAQPRPAAQAPHPQAGHQVRACGAAARWSSRNSCRSTSSAATSRPRAAATRAAAECCCGETWRRTCTTRATRGRWAAARRAAGCLTHGEQRAGDCCARALRAHNAALHRPPGRAAQGAQEEEGGAAGRPSARSPWWRSWPPHSWSCR